MYVNCRTIFIFVNADSLLLKAGRKSILYLKNYMYKKDP